MLQGLISSSISHTLNSASLMPAYYLFLRKPWRGFGGALGSFGTNYGVVLGFSCEPRRGFGGAFGVFSANYVVVFVSIANYAVVLVGPLVQTTPWFFFLLFRTTLSFLYVFS